MSKRILTYTIGAESSKINKPCRKCEKLFKVGDLITTRGLNTKRERSTAISYHSNCWEKLFI